MVAGDEEGHNATEQNGHDAGADRKQNGIQQGGPQVGLGQRAGEQVGVIDQGVALGGAGQVSINGAGVDLEGILHDGNDRRYRGNGEHNAHEQQDDIVRLGKEGLDLIAPHGGGIGLQNCGLFHGMDHLCWGRKGKRPGAAVTRSGRALYF